jgi:hypothetical protein
LIREDLIYDVTCDLPHHPVYDLAALAAQGTLREMNGTTHMVLRGVDEERLPRGWLLPAPWTWSMPSRRAGCAGGCCRMTARVDHIAGRDIHGRRGAVENAFRYGVDYVMVDPEVSDLRAPWLSRAKPGRVPFAVGS